MTDESLDNPVALVCESCGMPLNKNISSALDNRYCIHCQNQQTGELKNFEQVRASSIQATITLLGKTPQEAEMMADQMMPTLPRWQNKTRNI